LLFPYIPGRELLLSRGETIGFLELNDETYELLQPLAREGI